MRSSSQFNLPTSWNMIKDTRTRTGGDGGDVLPGGYDTIKGGRGGAKGYSKRKRDGGNNSNARFWSPYARPPRRSKKLVLIWLGAFLVIGVLTWYIASSSRRKASDALPSGPVPE